jgi:hypothetical protein
MMGQHARSESLFYYFRIEDQVPENHLLRLIDRHICFAGFGTDGLRCEEAMKTAGRENPNRWATLASNRAPGAGGQNRSCSIKWAEKQENVQPLEGCFFLTSPFIELTRQVGLLSSSPWSVQSRRQARRSLPTSRLKGSNPVQ